MAQFTKTNGTTQPVFALDVSNGSISGTANVAAQGPVQPQGPKLDFFSLVANASIASGGNVNGYVNNVLQSIQQIATVAMYQIGPNNQTINLALYPQNAYTTTTLVAAAQAANATGGLNVGIATANVANTATFTTLIA
jgi:hypothetical protein